MEVCIYDRIVYLNIVKKGINIFPKKGFLKGGAMLPRGGAQKNVCPPYTNALVHPWLTTDPKFITAHSGYKDQAIGIISFEQKSSQLR